jgi:hypothetical protein
LLNEKINLADFEKVFSTNKPNICFFEGRKQDSMYITSEQLAIQGFRPKYISKYKWSASEETKLENALKDLDRGTQYVHTINPYYWISHYVFDDTIPEKNIKKKIAKMLAQYI